MTGTVAVARATRWRRFACLAYEGILLLALFFVASFLVISFIPVPPSRLSLFVYQLYLVILGGLYFSVFWVNGGQTLAMKTWHIRLVTIDDQPLGFGRAWLRYGLAWLTLGFGILWAFVDRDRQFLHDRLAGTHLIMSNSLGAPKP